jgi:hypothetical protein
MRSRLQIDRQSEGPKERWRRYREEVVSKRQCAACDSKTSRLSKKGYPVWYNHGVSDGRATWDTSEDECWLCQSCYNHYVLGPARSLSTTLDL